MDGSFDPVEHPSHYTDGKYEVIDFIEKWGLGFHLGNAVKYISRAGKKDPDKEIEDLKKAVWYLRRTLQTTTYGSIRTISLNGSMFVIPVKKYCEDKGLDILLHMAIEKIVNAKSFDDCEIAIALVEERIRELENAVMKNGKEEAHEQ